MSTSDRKERRFSKTIMTAEMTGLSMLSRNGLLHGMVEAWATVGLTLWQREAKRMICDSALISSHTCRFGVCTSLEE